MASELKVAYVCLKTLLRIIYRNVTLALRVSLVQWKDQVRHWKDDGGTPWKLFPLKRWGVSKPPERAMTATWISDRNAERVAVGIAEGAGWDDMGLIEKPEREPTESVVQYVNRVREFYRRTEVITFDDNEVKVREVDFKVFCAECGRDLDASFDGAGELNVAPCGCQEYL